MRKLWVIVFSAGLVVAPPGATARSSGGHGGHGGHGGGRGGAHVHHGGPVHHGAFFGSLRVAPVLVPWWIPMTPPPLAPLPGYYYAPTPDEAALADFLRLNPCPSTGAVAGPCPGYLLAPIDPSRAISADNGMNLQWVTEAEARGAYAPR